MGLPTREDLATMRQDIKDGLGFGSSGSTFTANNAIIDSWLERAQRMIYWEHDFTELITVETITSQQGQEGYDWPTNTEPKKILSIWLEDTNLTSANWYPMIEGVGPQHYGRVSTADQGRPTRYERRDQLDIWRRPDDNSYTFHIEGIKRLGRLTAETDKATINEDLIKMLALAWGKAHYRHPDAQDWRLYYDKTMRRIKAGDQGKKKFIRSHGRAEHFVDRMYDRPEYHAYTNP